MEEQDKLKIGIGTKEIVSLKPVKVKIVKVSVINPKPENDKVGDMVSIDCKHPDKDETIKISSVKFEKKKTDKLEESGLWFNLDDDGKILKGSALAVFLEKVGAETISQLEGKEVETIDGKSGFLCFKAY